MCIVKTVIISQQFSLRMFFSGNIIDYSLIHYIVLVWFDKIATREFTGMNSF